MAGPLQCPAHAAELRGIVLKILLQVLINFALVAAVFIAGAYLVGEASGLIMPSATDPRPARRVGLELALLISLPFLIATYRKLKALALLMAELWSPQAAQPRLPVFLSEAIPLVALGGILALVAALSASILPPWEWLLAILAAAGALSALLWKWFVRLHTKLQIALVDTLSAEGDHR